jgi:hypothetical protein
MSSGDKILANNMGAFDFEALLDKRMAVLVAAKEVVRQAESEYLSLLRAGTESNSTSIVKGSKLRLVCYEEIGKALNAPSVCRQLFKVEEIK